jgi:hypothetical protein
MPRPCQRHHEDPRLERDTGLVRQHWPGAEVNLCGVGRREFQDRRRRYTTFGFQVKQKAPHGRVTAAVAMVAFERAEDRRALHAGVKPAADQIAKRLERGNAATRHLRIAPEDARQFGVVWQGPARLEPAVGKRDLPYGLQLAAPHQVRAGNVAVGIALAHAHQNLSIFEHFKSPVTHRPSGQKLRRYPGREIRNAFRDAAGHNNEPAAWLDYADPEVAPIRRSSSGSNTPILHWLDYGDHLVAPLRRSRNGPNTPIRDRRLPCRDGAFWRPGKSPSISSAMTGATQWVASARMSLCSIR